MGCHSSKTPTPATPLNALPADFDPAKTLLESPPPGSAEIKKESSMMTLHGDVEKKEAPETTQDLWHSPLWPESDKATDLSRSNCAKLSIDLSTVPSSGETGEACATPRSGGNTATSGQNTAVPSGTKPEIGKQDAQDALKAQKPETETTEASSEIISGLRTIADPIAPTASKIVNKSAEEVEAAKSALFDIKTATALGFVQGNEHCIVHPKTADDKAQVPESSVANTTSTRKERQMMCCC